LEPTGIEALFLRELVKLFFQEARDVFWVERLDMPSSQAAVLESEHHPVAANKTIPTESDFEDSTRVNRVQGVDPQYERVTVSWVEIHVRDGATPVHPLSIFRK